MQHTLREKLVELQALIVEEKRLMRGERTTSLPFLMLAQVSCELLINSAQDFPSETLLLQLVLDRSRSPEQQQHPPVSGLFLADEPPRGPFWPFLQ